MNLPDIEIVSAKVHEAWMASKAAQGVTSRKSEAGEELIAPYEQLSEPAKELDRGTVRAVYAAIIAASASPEPMTKESSGAPSSSSSPSPSLSSPETVEHVIDQLREALLTEVWTLGRSGDIRAKLAALEAEHNRVRQAQASEIEQLKQERDQARQEIERLKGELDAAETHVRILQQQSAQEKT